MAFVHEASGYRAGTSVEVFVAAPDREIDIPVMQFQRKISGCVRHVEADHASFRVSGIRDPAKIKCLSGVIIHAAEHDQRDFFAVTID